MPAKSVFFKPWYFFLLSVFFVFHGFTENFFLIPIKDTFLLLFIYLCSSILLAFLFRFYFLSTVKAAFFTFLLLAFNFFFGYLHDGLTNFFPGSFIVKYSVVLSLALVALVIGAILIKKRKTISKKLTLYLNLLFCVFIIMDMGVVIKKSIAFSSKDQVSKVLSCTKAGLPDVYLILADEYAGNKDLVDICGFDNTFFLDSLREKGFFVANNSRSNYNYTTYSMASILNMDYLPLKENQVKKADDLYVLKLIFNNKVTAFFKNAGYEFHNYSGFDIINQAAQGNNSFIPVRTTLFTSQTLLNRLKKDVWLNVARKLNLRPVLKNYAFKNLLYNQQIYANTLDIAHTGNNAPKFVYTHLQLPHFPYYYDKKGTKYPYEKLLKSEPGDRKMYIEYIQYSNQLLLKLVGEIIHNNNTPPVIILMSDHGYRCFPAGAEAYAFLNLFSVYLPDRNYSHFNDSLTNVNVFPALLNTLFCQQLPVRKDTTIRVSFNF